ncbi:MAG: carboxylesterase family protein, partial [Bifidobacteriaceae bacterium]|nr:carboxylesterase family protein [Bifidobacteriaceae bacterium]
MIVPTESGTVAGVPSGVPGVTVFRGVPYAADTGGQNRWRPPQPVEPWTGTRPASEFGAVCPQNLSRFPMDEDCLSVNVWTPAASAGEKLPVLVWIFGGRFIWGTGRDPLFDGEALAASGIVVVTLNYRVGALGWLATAELSAESGRGSSGNYGLLDQLAALDWVRRNIAGFGGDPGRVTIAGQSAGAASVMALVCSPLGKGLFHRVIAESGAAHPADPG